MLQIITDLILVLAFIVSHNKNLSQYILLEINEEMTSEIKVRCGYKMFEKLLLTFVHHFLDVEHTYN